MYINHIRNEYKVYLKYAYDVNLNTLESNKFRFDNSLKKGKKERIKIENTAFCLSTLTFSCPCPTFFLELGLASKLFPSPLPNNSTTLWAFLSSVSSASPTHYSVKEVKVELLEREIRNGLFSFTTALCTATFHFTTLMLQSEFSN